jgi:putative selenate reductase FAD-binding subunit
MITEYNRPSTLESALELLARKTPVTVQLAGGTLLNQKSDADFAVVDIQALPLKTIQLDGITLRLGAGVNLQELIDHPDVPAILKEACRKETSYNLRQMSTIGGCIAGGDGKSTLLSLLLAWNAQLEIQPGNRSISISELLPVRKQNLMGRLIIAVNINTTVKVAVESIAKSPADYPIAGVSMAQWPNGRTRVNVFGFGDLPVAAMDGTSAVGAEMAARNAFADSGDIHASTVYRESMAGVLVKRCLDKLVKEVK